MKIPLTVSVMEALTDGHSNISGLGTNSMFNFHRDLRATQIWFRD